MISFSSTFVAPDEFDIAAVNQESVHYVAWLHPHVRFRTGKLFRFRVVDDAPFEVWVYNRLEIPSGTETSQLVGKFGPGYSHLWSEVAVYIPNPRDVTDDLVEAIRQNKNGRVTELFRAMHSFNQFVCAYSIGTKQLFGGAPLRMLTDGEFLECLHAEITLLHPPGYQITDQDVEEIFGWSPKNKLISSGQLTGHLDDLQEEALGDLDRVLQEMRDNAFHEIAFRAKTEMVSREPITAVVLASAALEGVLIEFVRRQTNGEIRDGLLNNFFREQGMSTLVQIIPRLLIPPDQRPPDQLLKDCTDALTVRNKIVHAKASMRDYTFKELNDAFRSLFRMYDLLLSLITEGNPKAGSS